MDVIWLLVYWLVLLTAIYMAYSTVREGEQTLLRRPLSVPLTLAVVAAGTGLLVSAFNLITNNYVAGNSSYLNYYANGALPEVISVLLALGSGWLIRRDAVAAAAGADLVNGPASLKAALDLDWDDPAARQVALGQILRALAQFEQYVATQTLSALAAMGVAEQVVAQDVTRTPSGQPQLREARGR